MLNCVVVDLFYNDWYLGQGEVLKLGDSTFEGLVDECKEVRLELLLSHKLHKELCVLKDQE